MAATYTSGKGWQTEFSLASQIKEVERELVLRRNVYPGLVARGKMKQSEADYHLAAMDGVLTTLRKLQDEQGRQ